MNHMCSNDKRKPLHEQRFSRTNINGNDNKGKSIMSYNNTDTQSPENKIETLESAVLYFNNQYDIFLNRKKLEIIPIECYIKEESKQIQRQFLNSNLEENSNLGEI